MCECVAKINKKLAPGKQKLPSAMRISFATVDGEQGTIDEPFVIPLHRMDDKPERRATAAKYIVANFCPFCGERASSGSP